MNRKTISFLLAAVFLFSTGCASDSKPTPSETTNTTQSGGTQPVTSETAKTETSTVQTDTSAPAMTTTAAVTEPFLAEPLISMQEPVRQLSALHVRGTVSNIRSGGNHTVIVQYGTDKKQEYAVVDLMNDTVTQTGNLISADEIMIGCTPDGEFVSPELRYEGTEFTGTVRFYKNGKSRTISITPKLRNFTYSPERDCLYAYERTRKSIIEIKTDGTETTVCKLSDRSDFQTIYPERDILLTTEPSAELGILSEIACRSLPSGKILWQKPIGTEFRGGFTNGGVFAEDIIYDPTPLDEVNDVQYASYALSVADGELLGCSRMPDALSDYSYNQTGDFQAALSACINGNAPDAPENIRFTDLTSGKYTELNFPAKNITKAIPFFAADTGCWVAAYTSTASGDAYTEICLCNPTIENSSPSAEKTDAPTARKPHSCDPTLADARKLADYIEQKYGVRVLIGDEVLDVPLKDSDATVTTDGRPNAGLYADDPGNYPALDCSAVLAKLAVIEQKMQKYPEGFFRSFQTPDGKGGLRISLYQQIMKQAMGNAGGDSSQHGAWYEMRLVDETAFDHEMFHLVEFRLDHIFGSGEAFPDFGADSWLKLCPPDFKYLFDWQNYVTCDQFDQYILPQSMENAYFISRYSITDGSEDRAELVAGLFAPPVDAWSTESYPNMLALYQQCPHLMKKLDYIANRLRTELGSVYWEEIFDAGFDPFIAEAEIDSLTQKPNSILSYYGL